MLSSLRFYVLFIACLYFQISFGQKKMPLNHTVYDGWESIQERVLSDNGKWVAFTINPQEGDGKLVIEKADGTGVLELPRGYNVAISADSKYCIFRIKPLFKDTRQARISKKKPDDMLKDSLGILELSTQLLKKIPRVKSYKQPIEKTSAVAYLMDKPLPDSAKRKPTTKSDLSLDSALRVIDSLRQVIGNLPEKGNRKNVDDANLLNPEGDKITTAQFHNSRFTAHDNTTHEEDADADGAAVTNTEEGTTLIIQNFTTGKDKKFERVTEYGFSKKGDAVWVKATKNGKDSLSKASVIVYNTSNGKIDTAMNGFNEAKNFSMDENGHQLAFVAERDSSAKSVQQFYKVYYYAVGQDSARMIVDKNTKGKIDSLGISPFGETSFSKSGTRLFFGVAPVIAPKDTTIPDFEKASLDVWNYKDEYLQPVQWKNLERDLKRNYLCLYDLASNKLQQLADKKIDTISKSDEGDGKFFIGFDDHAYRIASQWTGRGKTDLYAINPITGEKILVKKGLDGNVSISPNGNFILWYDVKAKQYFTWNNGIEKNISSKIKVPLYNEENDVPDDPNAYGTMTWQENDRYVYVYDRYDIWKLDPNGIQDPLCITNAVGRKNKLRFRYERLRREDRFVAENEKVIFTVFDETNKKAALFQHRIGNVMEDFFKPLKTAPATFPFFISNIKKAKDADVISFSKETYQQSPDIEIVDSTTIKNAFFATAKSLYQPNPQQQNYNWGTAELLNWKAYDGKMTQGILYKPADFDPTKKYPLITYFYETLSDGLYTYNAPAPTPSRLNISFFVSRGYCVLAPDIHYKTGQPGQDAYNYIVSGVRYVLAKGFVDSTKMALQGQSWGGYQIAILITMTNMFKAAWAGAPVVNMTSAYGGIRWESGVNRQMQYEKTQSRIGASLFDRPDLYIKNSPLFHLKNVKTPLVIMNNDADGAVPWYQGIEFFTAMRRLDKPIWLLSYNGEAHNLVERRNRKDIQIREQEFFDWQLKGATPPKWITDGVPAVEKGRNWGL